MSKRTDIHSTSKVDPSAYVFVACDYHGGGLESMEFIGERQTFRAHMTRTNGKWAHITRADGEDGSHGCYICGAACMYVAKFYHETTNTYIETGMDCAGKMDMGDKRVFDSFRKKIRAGIEAAAGKAKAQRILADAGMSQAWEIYVADYATLPREDRQISYDNGDGIMFEERTIRDVISKLVRYGSVSEKQTAFVAKLLAKINDRARAAAERAAKDANRANLPISDKRVTVEGVIISAKYEEGGWTGSGFCRPEAVKVVVEHATGWKVWGSLPRDMWSNAATYGEASWNNGSMTDSGKDIDAAKLKGRTIRFDARLVASDKDSKFGFFKRPTKATWVEVAHEAAA